ncbi:MAG TPA: circadian clock KaiB family protein [Anaerolineae bacterium]|nr:circadian clock KaiB family protein [Anaerolineae bacterium]HQK15077.1 circadian clock KaiB family protein [Anaerolineae bacterium]
MYRLRLFVAGQEPNSVQAVATLRRLRETHLQGHCELSIVDVFEDYRAAIEQHVVAVPTLIIESPPPRRVIVGSLADEDKLLAVLGIKDPKGLEDL